MSGRGNSTLFWVGAAVFVVLAAVPLLLGRQFYNHLATLIAIYSLVAISVHLMLRIGQLSLAQAGFMGIGAYASALLTRDVGLPFGVAILLAGLIPAAIAALLGPILLRIKGVHFVLLTFALSEVVILVFTEWTSVFGGNNGLAGIPAASLFGFTFSRQPTFYLLAVSVLALVLLFCHMLLRSEIGMIAEGLAGNEPLQASLGVDVLAYRCVLFAISAFIAGIAGSLYAHYLTFISPEAFGFWTTVNALIMSVIGGAHYLMGALLGAILLVPLPEFFRDSAQYQRVLYGFALLFLMRGLPQGLLGIVLTRLRLKGDGR